jgi:hypothetical protein
MLLLVLTTLHPVGVMSELKSKKYMSSIGKN